MARRTGRRMMGRDRLERRWRRGSGGPIWRSLSMALAGICAAAALTMFFRVRDVRVTGAERYTAEQIRSAAEVRDGDDLFLLNKYTAIDKILRDLPYVEQVRIRRDLPDTLVIQVEECGRPLAVVQDGSAWLVSASGRIVDRVPEEEAGGHGRITGCALLAPAVGSRLVLATEDVGRQQSLLDLLSALGEAGMLEQVGSISMEDPGRVEMSWDGRLLVRLPYGADYAYKLRVLRGCLSREELDGDAAGILDLTRDDKIWFDPTA